MADKHTATKSAGTPAHDGARRPAGHRAVDARDAIAELTERAQEISLEAGSKVSTAMKDVIAAAAGIAGFAVESARDLVHYMVRRGQMTPEEADKMMREAEIAHSKRPASERRRPTASEVTAKERAAQRAKQAEARERAFAQQIAQHAATRKANAKKAAPKKTTRKAAPKKASARRASKPKSARPKSASKARRR